MTREKTFYLMTAATFAAVIVAGAGCTGAAYGGGGGGGNPTPTPPIPAGIYYANGGMTPNAVAALNSAPVAAGGNPSSLPGSPFTTGHNGGSGAPFGIALAKSGTVLYAVNFDANDVTAFTVNADGTLTAIAAGTTAVAGTGPSGICVDPASTRAAVVGTTSNTLDTFTIGASNVLALAHSATAGSNGLSTPLACAFSQDGKYLYVTNSAAGTGISAWQVAADGTLTANGMAGGANFQGVTTSANSVVFAASQTSNELVVFLIAANGTLTNQQIVPLVGVCAAPIGVALTPNGQDLYIACAAQRAVDAYGVNGQTLTHLSGAPYPTQANTSYLAISSSGNLLVALDPVGAGVTLFAIKSDGTVGFAPVNLYSINVPNGSNPKAIVVR